MEQVQKSSLNDAWKELHDKLLKSHLMTPSELIGVASSLLAVIGRLSDEKARLVARLRTQPQPIAKAYGDSVRALHLKGMAYEERRCMLELSEDKEIFSMRKRLEVLEDMMDSCRRIESTLKLIHDSMKLDLKLSYEGHS